MTLTLFLCPFLMQFNLFCPNVAFGRASMDLGQSWTLNKMRNRTPAPHIDDEFLRKSNAPIIEIWRWGGKGDGGGGGFQIFHLF